MLILFSLSDTFSVSFLFLLDLFKLVELEWYEEEEGHTNDPRAGTPLLWGKAERVGVIQPEEEKAVEKP